MIKNIKWLLLLVAILTFIGNQVDATESKVRGDPDVTFMSPLGDENVDNNAYNRCRLIRVIKPGVGQATTTARNVRDLLGRYASTLYAQSLKISAYINEEDEAAKNLEQPDISSKNAILEHEIINRLSDISRRLNIINSFEAGTRMVQSLQQMEGKPSSAYSRFGMVKNGKYVYETECDKLK